MLETLIKAIKSKTNGFGIALILLGVLEKFDITKIEAFIPDAYEPLIVSAIGFIVVVLRLLTTKPISEK